VREDRGAFDDRNYAANATEARTLGILHARLRLAKPPIPPPGARLLEFANLAQEPSKKMFSCRKMRRLKRNRNNRLICTESEAEPLEMQIDNQRSPSLNIVISDLPNGPKGASLLFRSLIACKI
jgi:hypothetical protein